MHKRIINQLIKLAATRQPVKAIVDHLPSTLNTGNVLCNDHSTEACIAAAPDIVDMGSIGAGMISKSNPALMPSIDKAKIVLNKVTPYTGIVGGGVGTALGTKQLAKGVNTNNIEDIGMGIVNTGAGIGTLVGGASAFAGSSLVPTILATPAVTAGAAIAGTLGASAAASNAVTHAFGVPIADAKLEDYLKDLARKDGTYDADKTYNSALWHTSTTLNHLGNQLYGIATAPKQIFNYLTAEKQETKKERRERVLKARRAQEEYEYIRVHGLPENVKRDVAKIEKEVKDNPETYRSIAQQVPYNGFGSSNIFPVF